MTVKELIEELKKYPEDTEVCCRYVGSEYNDDFEILSVELETKKWSLMKGDYIEITPRVVIH